MIVRMMTIAVAISSLDNSLKYVTGRKNEEYNERALVSVDIVSQYPIQNDQPARKPIVFPSS